MKRVLVVLALSAVACGKKEEHTAPKSEAPVASASASASAVPEKKAVPFDVTGKYASKQAEVRTPQDAPPFIHPESKEGLGDGELSITLPGGDGAAIGKGSGALGAQTFSGWVEGDRLTGTLRPTGAPNLYGVVDAKIEGDAVIGTIRASDADGRVVREASFKLEKKK